MKSDDLARWIRSLSRGRKAVIFWTIDTVAAPLGGLAMLPILPLYKSLGISLFPWLAALAVSAGFLSLVLRLPWLSLFEHHAASQVRRAAMVGGVALASGLVAPLAGLVVTPLFHIAVGAAMFTLISLVRAGLLRTVKTLNAHSGDRARVLIYGAGTTGRQLAQALQTDPEIEVVAMIDDNTTLQKVTVAGLSVYPPARIADLVNRYSIDRVCLAMPSVSPPKQAQMARRLVALGLEVQSVPSFSQLVGEGRLEDRLRPLDPMAFLARDEIDHSPDGTEETYEGRVVMVTGAGGSIGSELCRQVLSCRPAKLILMDVSEFALFTIAGELGGIARRAGVDLVPVLGSVCDARLVSRAIKRNGVQIVMHAAAYKHVHLVETNVEAGLWNNVQGTRIAARAARDAGVERFILVSSDKAVRPRSVMGASKRLAELILLDLAARAQPGGTIFAMVRFGNVLGSSGSVVPLFQDQIRRGGPVTVTHSQVCRYFMTIPEAGRLVLTAGAMALGGEVFVLDMGRPVMIAQLARQSIEAAGYTVRDRANPEGDIEIVFTGLRRGEKLFEELSYDGNLIATAHPKISCAREDGMPELQLAALQRDLFAALDEGDIGQLRSILAAGLEGFPQEAAEATRPPLTAIEVEGRA
ncbi:polysaccharide biosynthesis protein [Jannaschia aquimarina]|uniref:PglF protein n=1 Tax=Jannaschia aquimarina TaxID=935700 RepID=A0A0D1EG91_9RHOB|nr:nucleoside-diphosphate sugar epimerase/dehydratase [Jannaschia aquimarina]KIT16679.1 UDP-N-acetyl-alpha-D-glucosamine C6 dehydratase [Jannaschia aquimarina]SNS55290.1 NDP-sugar epimerase, includes UDP-GlcNAc-inverting 4,6-dehydratase FlaA1 and capsular polysaccharide biosynthesis protein EpsC [Jannaschia aquimarina]